MKVWHFGGEVECESVDELESILNMRYGIGVNEFQISGNEDYPYLSVLVNDCYAFIAFFPKEEDFILQSIGTDTKLNPDEMSTFYIGTPTETTEVWNEFVVQFSKAKEVAIEFFTSLSLPACIEWSKQ